MRKLRFFLYGICACFILAQNALGQGPRAQLVSALVDGCAAGANESLQEYMVVYTGPSSFVAGNSTIDIKYGPSPNPTTGITDSFIERSAIVADMNANLPGGCDFSFSSVNPGVTTVNSNSHILIHRDGGGNLWPTVLDYSGWCGQNLGTVYVMWSTDPSWPSGGRFDDFPATSVYFESTINGTEVDFEYSADWAVQLGGNYLVWANGGGQPTTYDNYVFCGASDASSLPVNLLAFDARVVGNSVELAWVTAGEESNDYFVVQRSQDWYTWSDIGFVSGNGTTDRMTDYSFTDLTPPNGRVFYRLKQVDFNGEFEIFEIKLVDVIGNLNTLAYPNPATDRISIPARQSEVSEVRLVDMSGNEHTLRKLDVDSHSYDLSQFQSGIYLLKYLENGRPVVSRIRVK